jgi:hypothetical protein
MSARHEQPESRPRDHELLPAPTVRTLSIVRAGPGAERVNGMSNECGSGTGQRRRFVCG